MHRPPPTAPAPKDFGALTARLAAVADDAVIVTDAQQRIVFFNESAERVFGHGSAQVLGEPLSILLPESRRAAHEEHLQRFAASDQAARCMSERSDIQGRRADGSLFEAEASIAQLTHDGRSYFAAILRDVSESRRAARALLRSELRFRTLAASAPVGIFQTDTAGGCVYVNERWCAMAGMDAAEAVGAGWQRAVHPADRARVWQAWQDAVASHAPFELEFRFLRPDGTETWVIGRAVAGREPDGTPGGFLGTVTDVTEVHAQAQALEQARAEAEEAVRAKSLFLANMSHEIRTPLNAVIGMTTLLLDTGMSAEQREMAGTIRAGSETLLDIINDILDYSKADVGKLEIEQQRFDLRRCVEESLDMVAPRALEKRLNLAYLIEDGTPEALVGDATRVRQILVNLLSNAVKFTHQGEVYVSVDSEPLGDGRHRIHFAVHDSGIGIAAEHLPRLFQSFSQLDASTTRKYGGTGLGLAISRRLAELMGGELTAQSEPGQGSVFHATVVARDAGGEPPEFLRRDVPTLAGKRLLVVDDNLSNRRILTRLALRWGMVPSTLPSALEALDRLRHGERYDVAVLDMRMPGLSGIDLAVEIRQRRGPQELPIVILTSLGHRRGTAGEDAAGVSAYLAKPIKAAQLYATLVGAIQGRPGAPLPAPADPPAAPRPRPARLPLKVLVAEDNTINQRVATRLLQGLGVQADVAANGLEVIEAVEQRAYDVVLMDIQMPEMDGLQAAEWIVRRRGPEGTPRLIAMTANAMPGERERCLAAGMDDYVAKPIQLGALAAALARVADVAVPHVDEADPVLDVTRLEHLRQMQAEGQPSVVQELIDLFVADAHGHVDALAAALDASDAARLGRAAHRLLSITQNIGAQRMSRLCIEIEGLAREGRLAATASLVAALGPERESVQGALLALRERY